MVLANDAEGLVQHVSLHYIVVIYYAEICKRNCMDLLKALTD